jgi:hypothetical protein
MRTGGGTATKPQLSGETARPETGDLLERRRAGRPEPEPRTIQNHDDLRFVDLYPVQIE